MRKRSKPKTVSYELLTRDSVIGHPMYALLDELITKYHQDLRDARIALAWCTSWKPDVDGRVTLGKCRRASDLDRELAAFDFIILLRRAFWQHPQVTDTQRTALLDHELCHGALKFDATGEPVEDARGRKVYRVCKHDIEEFTVIVARHGCYKADLEAFAKALGREKPIPFTPCEACQDSPGWVPVVVDGVARVTRCACYVQWVEQKELQLAVNA